MNWPEKNTRLHLEAVWSQPQSTAKNRTFWVNIVVDLKHKRFKSVNDDDNTNIFTKSRSCYIKKIYILIFSLYI